MWTDSGMLASLTLTAIFVAHVAGGSAPGRPRLTSCRSPEKETFTCWWEPGEDGGLPTTHALYYHLESSETVYECPDYRTAGENSCFFSKNNTSLWVNYNISVVATNSEGSSVSEAVEVDVAYIVQPNTPENVSVEVLDDDPVPYLHVWWEPPLATDTQSGWITLFYQLRVKRGSQDTWEEYNAGMQKSYNIFSVHSGCEYSVQVRCRPDHGFWSEWTTPTYVQIPDYMPGDRSMWIVVAVFAGFTLLILSWTVNVKRSSVKHCLLPPVPGPKIKGFDQQLLKSGKSEEMFNALLIQGFPPTSSYDDLLVEYLEVYDVEKQELVLDRKDTCEDALTSTRPPDSDSGRGSCDSHTLLTERCTEGGDEGGALSRCVTELASLPLEEGKVEAWSAVVSPSQPHQHGHHQQGAGGARETYHVLEIPCASALGSGDERVLEKNQWGESEVCKTQPGSEVRAASTSLGPPHQAEYVEVQTVDHENALLLRPLTDPRGHDLDLSDYAGEDYSKVKEVTSDNVLLLQRGTSVWRCEADSGQDQEELPQSCPPQPQDLPQSCKPAGPLQDGVRLVGDGYVDSTALLC
ncbi:prolactin receptor a [Brachyhypopomus gauderio]|uniref:prolactin receptor a n=1 Tax=Brachyhypopomus gauderio TaxID=698409 RepID=UPI0040424B10